jgi:hypothetical protein
MRNTYRLSLSRAQILRIFGAHVAASTVRANVPLHRTGALQQRRDILREQSVAFCIRVNQV